MNFRKIYNSILAVCLCAVFFSSCENTIEMNPPYTGLLVVDGIFGSGDTIGINLFKNIGLSESTNISDYYFQNGVNRANAVLYDNGVLADTLMPGKYDCNYRSKVVAQEGHTYRIEVSHSDYPTLTAGSRVPLGVSIDSVGYQLSADGINLKMIIYFTDDKQEENYYSIRMFTMTNGFRKNRGFYNIDPIFGSELKFDFNILGFQSGQEEQYRVDFNDELYSGKPIVYQALLPLKFEGTGAVNDIQKGDTIGVRLYSVDKSIDEYNKSLQLYQQAQNSGAQPTGIYTNTENGAGLFSGYALRDYIFVLR